MTPHSAYVLALLLNYLVSSEGTLSAPLNLKVDLLDFQVFTHWLPGADTPAGTRYSLEFTAIENYSKPVWSPLENCTNITSTHCNFTLQDCWVHYFIRVRAEREHERSNWTLRPTTLQLYTDTRLSPPNLVVRTDQYSVYIQLSHLVQSLKDVPLRFSIDLFQAISDNIVQHLAQDRSTGSYSFSNLPPGNYCVNASAFYMQRSQRFNYNTTRCFSLAEAHTGKTVYIIGVGVALLLIVPTGIGLSVICCYVNSQSKENYNPKALNIIKIPSMVLTLSPDECHTLSLSSTTNSDTGSYEEEDSISSDHFVSVYAERIVIGQGSSTSDLKDSDIIRKIADAEDNLCNNSDLLLRDTHRCLPEERKGDLLQRDTHSCPPEERKHLLLRDTHSCPPEERKGDLLQRDTHSCLPEEHKEDLLQRDTHSCPPEERKDLLLRDTHSCPPEEPVHLSSVIIFRVAQGSFDKSNEEMGTESPLRNQSEVHAEDCPETDYQSEGTEKSKVLTDSDYHSAFVLSNDYEPRPDPWIQYNLDVEVSSLSFNK